MNLLPFIHNLDYQKSKKNERLSNPSGILD